MSTVEDPAASRLAGPCEPWQAQRVPTPRSVSVVSGVPIDVVTRAQALDRVVELIELGRRHRRGHQVVTVNVDFVINASNDEGLRDILRHADLAIADGMPLVWASRWLGAPLPERVTGADLVPSLAARAAEQGLSMLLFGAAPGVADRAADVLRRANPGLQISAMAAPFFDSVDDTEPAVLDEIRVLDPDIVCVALGHPKQDRWIAMNGPALAVPVMIGVGGSLDFLAGASRRAPSWMQASGLEWFHRLLHEPRRLGRRYGRDLSQFGPLILRQRLSGRVGVDAVGHALELAVWRGAERTPVWTDLRGPAVWDDTDRGVVAIFDLDTAGPPSTRAAGELVAVHRHLRTRDGELLVVASGAEVAAAWRPHLDGLVPIVSVVPDLAVSPRSKVRG